MSALIVLIIIVAALSLFGAMAIQFGVDSRIDSIDPRRSA